MGVLGGKEIQSKGEFMITMPMYIRSMDTPNKSILQPAIEDIFNCVCEFKDPMIRYHADIIHNNIISGIVRLEQRTCLVDKYSSVMTAKQHLIELKDIARSMGVDCYYIVHYPKSQAMLIHRIGTQNEFVTSKQFPHMVFIAMDKFVGFGTKEDMW